MSLLLDTNGLLRLVADIGDISEAFKEEMEVGLGAGSDSSDSAGTWPPLRRGDGGRPRRGRQDGADEDSIA